MVCVVGMTNICRSTRDAPVMVIRVSDARPTGAVSEKCPAASDDVEYFPSDLPAPDTGWPPLVAVTAPVSVNVALLSGVLRVAVAVGVVGVVTGPLPHAMERPRPAAMSNRLILLAGYPTREPIDQPRRVNGRR